MKKLNRSPSFFLGIILLMLLLPMNSPFGSQTIELRTPDQAQLVPRSENQVTLPITMETNLSINYETYLNTKTDQDPDGALTYFGFNQNISYFGDFPLHVAESIHTSHLVDEWSYQILSDNNVPQSSTGTKSYTWMNSGWQHNFPKRLQSLNTSLFEFNYLISDDEGINLTYQENQLLEYSFLTVDTMVFRGEIVFAGNIGTP